MISFDLLLEPKSLILFCQEIRSIVHKNLYNHMPDYVFSKYNKRGLNLHNWINDFDKRVPNVMLLIMALRIKTIFLELMEKKGIHS